MNELFNADFSLQEFDKQEVPNRGFGSSGFEELIGESELSFEHCILLAPLGIFDIDGNQLLLVLQSHLSLTVNALLVSKSLQLAKIG